MSLRSSTCWSILLALVAGVCRLFAQEAAPPAKAVAPATKPAENKAAAKPAEKKTDGGKFLRLIRNDKQTITAMETSVARYVSTDPAKADLVIDLISAVHVGEKSYYEELNKRFESYDVVLYELVAEEGTRIPKGGGTGRRGGISSVQTGMKDILELDFQLEQVDYTKKNLVHADMSPDQFSADMKQKGESMTSMIFKMMGASMAVQSQMQAEGKSTGEMEMLFALFDTKNRALRLKRAMAQQFENMENLSLMFGGKDGSTIIEGRNKAAFEVLKKELAAGKKKIGVFYGGGHMPDMEKRLLADHGMKFKEEEWIPAWVMPEGKAAAKPAPDKKPAPAK